MEHQPPVRHLLALLVVLVAAVLAGAAHRLVRARLGQLLVVAVLRVTPRLGLLQVLLPEPPVLLPRLLVSVVLLAASLLHVAVGPVKRVVAKLPKLELAPPRRLHLPVREAVQLQRLDQLLHP